MAATLVLNNNAKALVVDALKENLTHVFLGTGSVDVGTKLTPQGIPSISSDGSNRIKQPRIDAITTEYRTYNNLVENDESRITNFYIVDGRTVNRLYLMNSNNFITGIITFPAITPTETKSLYIPEIKINVL